MVIIKETWGVNLEVCFQLTAGEGFLFDLLQWKLSTGFCSFICCELHEQVEGRTGRIKSKFEK